jgi:hypothetical protein
MKTRMAVVLIVLAFIGAACTTTTTVAKHDPTKGPTDESIAQPVQIIDHQYRGLKEVPAWVTMEQGELDNLEEFKDYIVFKEFVQGKDLNAVKQWAQNFVVDDQISRLVSNRIQSKFAGAMVGTVDGAEAYFEKIVKSMTSARVAGTRRHAQYWILRRYINPDETFKDVYEYYILVKVPQAEVKKAVARAFNENPPKTEDEIRARDKVKEIMDSEEEW